MIFALSDTFRCLELRRDPREVVGHVRCLCQNISKALERPIFVDRGPVTRTHAFDPPFDTLDLFLN